MMRSKSMLLWSLVPMAVGVLSFAQGVQAAEASLVSGLYKSESVKRDDVDDGKEQSLELGARFSDALDQQNYWFVTGLIQLKSYSKGDMPDGPDDSTGLDVGGGVRHYFNKFSENISPYAEGQASFRDTKYVTYTGPRSFDQTESNGLYYGASFGIRFSLAHDFFVDFQTKLFDSAFFATEKTDHVTFAGSTKNKSTDQTKRLELYAASYNGDAFGSMLVSMGMRF